MKAKVAVLLAAYNGEAYIEAQIISILSQTCEDICLYIRDDGSSDQTNEVIRKFACLDRVVILEDGDATGSATGNFFKMLSSIVLENHEFVAFSDQDDIWDPSKLERATARLSAQGCHGYSADLISYSNAKNNASYLKKSHPARKFDYIFQGASAGCTYVLTAELARIVRTAVSGIDSAMFLGRSHDWLIYAIARTRNLNWYADNYAPIFYRQHANNVYGAMGSLQGVVDKIRLVRSGWYRSNIQWIADVAGMSTTEEHILSLVRRNSFASRLQLVMNVKELRRTRSDRRALIIILLFGLL